jgi:hypothetical protein
MRMTDHVGGAARGILGTRPRMTILEWMTPGVALTARFPAAN